MDYTECERLKKEIMPYIEEHLKPSRLEHTLNVTKVAKEMAERFGEDVYKAEIAALLHDMAKYEKKPGVNMDFAHSKIGAEMSREIFGIEDEDILNAIAYHTTGRAGMSKLEKIIFLADAIEPGRTYPRVDEIREVAETDLDKACILSLERTIEHVRDEKGWYLHPDSLKAKQYLEENKLMEPKELAELIAKTLDDKKGIDVALIDIAERSSFADYFVLVSAGNERHAQALREAVEDVLEPMEIFPKNVEGKNKPTWILMDYRDVIVNIMTQDARDKYSLEKIWGDCEITLCN